MTKMAGSSKKICLIFNMAPHYREAIFKKIDSDFDCDWYFGVNDSNIKSMNTSSLKRVTFLPQINYWGKNKILYRRKGLSSLIQKDEYQNYIITGENRNISIWLLLIRAKLFYKQKRVFVWTHGWYGKESFFLKLFKKVYFKFTDGIFLYGNYAKDLMIREGIKKDKLFVLHNSLDYEKHKTLRQEMVPSTIFKDHFKNDYLNLIFIGRLTLVKRLDYLIKALSIMKSKGVFYNLTFIGDGIEKEKLQKMVNDSNLTNQVWFYGACYDEKVNAQLIYNADACVSPGNVGLTALHVMTFGTPVLTHNNFPFQMPEFEAVKEGRTGDFFKQNDTNSIIRCIENWFKEHTNRERVRQDCYSEIDEYWTPQFQLNVLRESIKSV